MKSLLPFTILLCLLLGACKKGGDDEASCGIPLMNETQTKQLSVLFIGTSHTHFNDMPKMFEEMAHASGDSAYTQMSAPGGYDFQRHVVLPETVAAIKAKKWDYVVLQESGWRTSLPQSMKDTMVDPFAKSNASLIKANHEATKIVLYMTHGYKVGLDWCDEDPRVCNFDGMQAEIKKAYLHLANLTQATIAPAGLMWKLVMQKNSNLNLFYMDGIHPNIVGSYVTASTLFCTIFQKKPGGAYIPAGMNLDEVELIQNTVSNSIFNCQPNWKDL